MLALVVSTRGDEAELAADALWSLGVVAIEERGEADQVELWTSLGDDAAAVTGAVAQRLAAWNWRFVEVDEAVERPVGRRLVAGDVGAPLAPAGRHRGTIRLDSPATTIGLQVTIALPRVVG